MGSFMRTMLLAVLVFAPARSRAAEPDGDPSGHWEGTLDAPSAKVTIEIDLARNRAGGFVGTFGNPGEGESGLPLASVAVAGKTVTLVLKATNGGGTFRGTLDGSGKAMSGDFALADGRATLPFRLQRTGDARITPPPKSPPISKRLEGRWTGTLEADGKQQEIVLVMANQPDGTASGTLISSGLSLPIAMTQKAASLRVEVPSVRGTYTGLLNDAGTQLTGTWSQKSLTLPLTFQRTAR
jgi:hypothetical protein